VIRRATAADASAAAELLLRARKAAAAAGTIPHTVHEDDDVRNWIATLVIPKLETWLAEQEGELAGILVLSDGWIEQLYVEPALTGQGIGSELLDFARQRQPVGLRLWTFQSNLGAQRFYERHGFVEAGRTDGDNEEGAPDILYVWRVADTLSRT
jgi:GNAT superfamily N-acetyltransferase